MNYSKLIPTLLIIIFLSTCYVLAQKALPALSKITPAMAACDDTFFTINNSSTTQFAKSCLNTANLLYSQDSRFTLFRLPSYLNNLAYIKTPNNEIKDNSFLQWSITTTKPTKVYILNRHIPGINATPQWIINQYQRVTDNNLTNLTQYVLRKNELGLIGLYHIYEKNFQPGTITFSNANDQIPVAYSMYSVALVPLSSPPSPSAGTSVLPAFPGAEGYGAIAKGGRGGRIIQVTNLNDSGIGSLRSCIQETGPRTCIFRIGGTITLNSSLDVTNPYLTIAGQTAPGGGITLRTSSTNNKGLVVIKNSANDTIIRYIRSRPGPGGTDGDTLDAFTINAPRVILDHVSASWAVDETVNTWYQTAQNITIQWSIISEGLSNSIHPKGEHSKGLLMGDFNKNISVHHTLFAHNMDRHPEIKGDPSGVLEAINNIIYNYGWRSLLVSDNNGLAKVNIIGNFFKPGPNSPSIPEIVYYNSTGQGVQMFVKGNTGPHRLNDTNQLFQRINNGQWSVVSSSTPDSYLVTTPFPQGPIPVQSSPSQSAYESVLTKSGASVELSCQGIFTSRRDSVDTRIINNVRNGTGKIINHPDDVGGWPILPSGSPCEDSDNDGMSDEWEISKFGNINRGSATISNSDLDGDGYTDLEEFLNQTDPKSITIKSE